MIDLLVLAAAAAAVFVVAALAQAVTGFGSALVAVPLLTWWVDPVAAIVATTAVGLVLSSGAALRERSYVDRGAARLLTVTGVLGMPAGLVLLEVADQSRLEALISAAVLVMVLFVAGGARVGPRGLPVVGVASGALLTSTGMNGPPLVMGLIHLEPRGYRATLQAVFAVQDLVAVAAFLAFGHLDVEAAVLAAGGLLGLPLGWTLGDAVFRRTPAARLRPLTIGALVLTAASMLAGALV